MNWLLGGTAPLPPTDNFMPCLAIVLENEGGFVDNPADAGGPTNHGITLRTLNAYLGRAATLDELRNIEPATVAAIYHNGYWAAGLARGVDLVVFDAAVMSGKAVAARFLQYACGAVQDGVIGYYTLSAAAQRAPADLIGAISLQREGFYHGIVQRNPGQQVFLNGWLNRVARTKAAALAMAA
jgi:lysozyme family protein